MDDKTQLTKNFIMVSMGQVDISTDEKYIIGTQALSPCIGFILHSKDMGKAVVGHISSGQLVENSRVNDLRFQISELLDQGNLKGVPLDLKIIEGAYPSTQIAYSHELDILDIFGKSQYTLPEVLEEVIKKSDFVNISTTTMYQEQNSTPEVQVVDYYEGYGHGDKSKQFAFDAKNGNFVTDKVYFGPEYFEINKSNIK